MAASRERTRSSVARAEGHAELVQDSADLFKRALLGESAEPEETDALGLSRPKKYEQSSTAAEEKATSSPHKRVNHLGVSVRNSGKPRVKYSRTLTILYERERSTEKSEEQRMKLMREVRTCHDFSLAALHELFKLFMGATRPSQSLVGPRTFRMVLFGHGVRDTVLSQRCVLLP